MRLRRLLCRLFGHTRAREAVCWGPNYEEIQMWCARCGARLDTYGLTPLGRVSHAIGDVQRRRCLLCRSDQWHIWAGPSGWVCLGYPNARLHTMGADVREDVTP